MAVIPASERSPEERRENGRKGGIKSGESKRRKKEMKETLEILLSLPIKSGKDANIEAIKNFTALKGKNINVQEAMMVAIIQRALKGSIPAAEYIRDTMGENPVQKIDADVKNIVPVIGGENDLEDAIPED